MIEDDKLIRKTPIYDRGDCITVHKVIITKEEFIECYNAWIKEKNNERNQI